MSVIQSTYKSRDTEEFLDRWFYRPFGYSIALLAVRFGLPPNGITFMGMLTGILSGILFFNHAFDTTIIASILLIISETFDSTDGQLARMTNNHSKIGRIFDGLATYFVFLTIYIAIYYRLSEWTLRLDNLILVLAALFSHSLQTQIADYFRNCYLLYGEISGKGELEFSNSIKEKLINAKGITKIFYFFYYRYTVNQELLTGDYVRLREKIENQYKDGIPPDFSALYRKYNKAEIKFYNILTSNTRMFTLIFLMLIDKPLIYVWFSIVPMNLLLIYVLYKQKKIASELNKYLKSEVEV